MLSKILAEYYHRNQMYGKDAPYVFHLEMCVQEYKKYCCEEEIEVDETMVNLLYLHDIKEDTNCPDYLIKSIQNNLLRYVDLITDVPAKDRKTSKELTMERIKTESIVYAAKCIDRYCNVKFSHIQDNKRKLEMYKKETHLFTKIDTWGSLDEEYMINYFINEINYYLKC